MNKVYIWEMKAYFIELNRMISSKLLNAGFSFPSQPFELNVQEAIEELLFPADLGKFKEVSRILFLIERVQASSHGSLLKRLDHEESVR